MAANKNSRCVTFDLWQTLIFDEPEGDMIRSRMRYEGLHRVLADIGVKLPLDSVMRAYEGSASRLQAIWRRNEDLSTDKQIRMIIDLATREPATTQPDMGSAKMLENAYVDPVFAHPPRLNEDALTVLEGLRKRGIRVGLISNTGRTPGEALRRVLEKHGLLRFFDMTVFSDEVRCRKPDRRIFELAAVRLGADLTNMIHVGDDPEADIWGAKQAGMHALLFEPDTIDVSKWRPSSLFVLSRADRHLPESEIRPDRRIRSLTEALDYVDGL